MSENAQPLPTEEYIAGREVGRIAGLKRVLKVRLERIVAAAIFGGAFAAAMIASPAATGQRSFSLHIGLSVIGCFIAFGCLGGVKAVHSYRRSMRHLREDIVRSVTSPDDTSPEPGRLRKWWLRGEARSDNPWELSAEDRANEPHRNY